MLLPSLIKSFGSDPAVCLVGKPSFNLSEGRLRMRNGFLLSSLVWLALCTPLECTEVKVAYTLESRELSRRPNLQKIYSDTVIRTLDGVWDLDTDTELASLDGDGKRGTFLDFDLESRRTLHRQARYNGRYWFIVDVRSSEGEILLSLDDRVSHEPEAFFVANGDYLLKRTNDSDTKELTLELYRITTGERVWRHTPGGSPRWRLSNDSRTIIELISKQSERTFHTAIFYDTLTGIEVSRHDIRGLGIRRDSVYLSSFSSPVVVLGGQSGSSLFHEQSRSLSSIGGNAWGIPFNTSSPRLSSDGNTILLNNFDSVRGNLAWAVFDTSNGTRIATSDELQNGPLLSLRVQDPALSANGKLVYQVVDNGKIEVWNAETKSLVRQLSYSNIPFEILVPSPDDRHLLALALSGVNDDFMVLIDTETNLPVYSKLKRDPDIFNPPSSGFGYVVGFTRTLKLAPSRNRFYLSTVQGFEAFDFLSGEKVEDGSAFAGKAITSRYIQSENAWVTVYDTGRVKIESDSNIIPTEWIQLPNTRGIKYAAIDSQSGSIAFQRDRAFFITHPFDEREDQWIGDLSLGIHPISLHHGGTLLAALYRGVYDLENGMWLPLEADLYENSAVDPKKRRLAQYLPASDAIVVQDFENPEASIDIPRNDEYTSLKAIAFSNDGLQLYALVYATIDSFAGQCVFVVDLQSKATLQRLPVYSDFGENQFTRMIAHPTKGRVLLSRRRGNTRSLDLESGETSLPVLIEPIYSADWDNGIFELSPSNPQGRFRFIDEYGNVYQLQESSARIIPSKLKPSYSSIGLLFDNDPERSYWIESSNNLRDWTTLKSVSPLSDWFDSNKAGFFRVYESQIPE